MSKNNIWISPHTNGWQAKREGANRASGIFDTQKEAINYAHGLMLSGLGGELITQGKHGEIISKDTINGPDNDPPHDYEH